MSQVEDVDRLQEKKPPHKCLKTFLAIFCEHEIIVNQAHNDKDKDKDKFIMRRRTKKNTKKTKINSAKKCLPWG